VKPKTYRNRARTRRHVVWWLLRLRGWHDEERRILYGDGSPSPVGVLDCSDLKPMGEP
jgi:hypothetical protein